MKHQTPLAGGYGPTFNRLTDVLEHTDRYAFVPVKRLALDTGVNPSSISRLLNHQINPSFALVARITAAIEKELGMPIDPRNIVAEGGKFLTHSVCDLVGCPGCLPAAAYDELDETNTAFLGVKPGTWVSSRHPHGYTSNQESQHGQ
ncbi:MAG: hypothetical protein GC165_00165 [Armatimonadetes bacterium]|nr:hypothetical protein [Armatimonadota bacterium]